MDSLILASNSPRRREILNTLKIPFIVYPPDDHIEKSVIWSKMLRVNVLRNSKNKALNVLEDFRNGLILGVDTVVVLGNIVMGKPSNELEAKRFLRLLSGKKHIVISGLSIIDAKSGKTISGIAKTDVFFKKLSKKEVDYYIQSNEWVDKAGGYAIQGLASFFINKIYGSFYNVVGLPVELLYDMLKKFNYFDSSGMYRPLRKL